VVRRSTLDQHPRLAAHLNTLSTKLDNATISSLNAMIDLQRRPVEDVAASFLRANSLM
jgi:osmoprotectant transport system substrate-binding protein